MHVTYVLPVPSSVPPPRAAAFRPPPYPSSSSPPPGSPSCLVTHDGSLLLLQNCLSLLIAKGEGERGEKGGGSAGGGLP